MQEQLKASAHIPDSFPTAGSVEVFDSASPRAGEPCDLEIGVTLEEDVPAGRSIELWLHFVSDAEILQVEEPRSKNYLRVATSGPDVRTYIDPLQKVHGEGAFFPYRRIAGARLQENAPEGTRLRFIISRLMMQTYEESLFNLRFALMEGDSLKAYFGDAFYAVRGAAADHLLPVAPTCVQPGGPFDLPIVVRDRFGNKSGDDLGKLNITLKAEDDAPVSHDSIHYDEEARLHVASGVKINGTGTFYLRAESDGDDGLVGMSNPIISREEWDERVLWGDLHQHAYYCDGRGTPGANYRYALSTSCLDFCSVCPHQHHTVSPPQLYLDDPPPHRGWEELVEAARRYNDAGLITILGSEVNTMRGSAGDMNSYYLELDNRPELERLRKKRGLDARSRADYEDFEEYLSILEDSRGEVLLMPHAHAAGGPEQADIPRKPYMTNVEACSVHGNFEEYYRVWLRNGWKVGVHGGGDNHMTSTGNARPGNHYPNTNGLTGAWCETEDRRGVWDAYKKRRTYAVTGNQRIFLECRIGDTAMGEVADSNESRPVRVRAAGTEPLLSVELIRDGEVVRSYRPEDAKGRFLRLLWTDNIRSRRTDCSRTTGTVRVRDGRLNLRRALRRYNRSDEFTETDGCIRFRSNAYSGSWRGFIAEVEAENPESLDFAVCDRHHGEVCLREDLQLDLREQSQVLRLPMDTEVQRPRRNFSDEPVIPELTLWIDWIDPDWPRTADLEWDVAPGSPSYVRVRQVDGNEAWSSAIWWEETQNPNEE